MKPPRPIPPKLANRMLRSFLRNDLAEEVAGDLDEKFYSTLERKSLFKAKLNYWYEVFNYLRPFAIRKSKSLNINQYDMFQSYFKIGLRNLLKNKGYSFINIGGLAIGMAVAMLIGLWIHDEISFNKYHENYSSIGQVLVHNGEGTYKAQPIPLAAELRSSFRDDFKSVVMSTQVNKYIIASGDKIFSQQGTYMQTEGPEMLTLRMVYGSRTGLNSSHSILLSESLSKKLFGGVDPMNKAVRIDNELDVTVTGVYEDLPQNSEFNNVTFIAPWDLLISSYDYIKDHENDWRGNFLFIYAQIAPHTDFEKVSVKIKDAKLSHISKEKAAQRPELFVHPMSKWHLYPKFQNRTIVTSEQLQYVWLYGTIGIFILFLACINFMNLSTARSEHRAKEVGIRKTMGSVRAQLVNQFFSESFITVALSLMLSLLIVKLALPWFNEVAGKAVGIPWTLRLFWASAVAFSIITGLLAGSYPALYLSSFNPVKVLKGRFRAERWASVPRKMLVVVQFTVSIMLMMGTIVVFQQIQFAKDRPVGYSRDGLLMFAKTSPDFQGKFEVLRDELKKTGVVLEVAESSSPVTGVGAFNGGFAWKGKDPDQQTSFGTIGVTPECGKTTGWELVDGRDFSRDFASDSAAFVINETAARYMGLQNPVGEVISWDTEYYVGGDFEIIGVVKDLVMTSPFEPVAPTIFFLQGYKNYIFVKINPDVSASVALTKIDAVFKKIVPAAPFEYSFADDKYALKFATEERIGKLAFVFAVLAIFISCLGLFGLASFVAEQRTKEIGIRKIVGATVFGLWRMLSRDFVALVMVACLIALPAAWFFLSNWLEKYPYRITISSSVFIVTVAGVLGITLFTVSYQAIRAALMNPVESLRSE